MARDLKQCHPELQEKAEKLLSECKKQGLTVKVGECFRSVAEQNALYAKGRTAPGKIVTYANGSSYSSMHQWGVAFDIIRNDGKGAFNNSDGWFDKVGKIGKSIGLEWGGDWTKPKDRPHFQLPYWGSTADTLKKKYGIFENFKREWRDFEVVENIKIKIDGKIKEVQSINKNGFNFIKLRDLEDIVKIGYDADNKVPIIEKR